MLSKEQKIEKLKKIAQMADKINSVGNVFIAKKFDDIEENISSLDSTLADYIENIPVPKEGEKGEKGDQGERGEQGLHGMKGDKGDKGDRGEKGEKGDDGFGIDGKDGKDGVNGKDGSPDTPEEIVVKLNTLEKVLDRKVIKGLETFVDQSNLDRAISILDQRTQFLLSKRTAPDPVATAWGTITGTLSDQTDLQAALDAKGTVTSVAALTLGTTGTDLSSTVATGTTTPVITLNVPTASATNRGALSSTDWSTFNSKESALTFSTGLTRTTNTITANLSTGVSGGQSVIGGTASGNNLTLSSTSNATKGKIIFGTSAYDEVNNRLGIGTTVPPTQMAIVNAGIAALNGGSFSDSTLQLRHNNENIGRATAIEFSFGNGNNSYVGSRIVGETASAGGGNLHFQTGSGSYGTYTTKMIVLKNGNVGIGQNTPTAYLHLKAGSATAGTAPLKFTAGTNMTTPENGTFEFDGTNLYFTVGGVRKTVTLV